MPRVRPFVKCSFCEFVSTDQSMSTHVRRKHASEVQARAMERGDISTKECEARNSSFSLVSAQEFRPQASSDLSNSGRESVASVSTEMEYLRSGYTHTATRVLDRHHQLSEVGLLQFLEEEHPEVDPAHRCLLLQGAVSGVRLAAKLHVFARLNERSTDPGKREAANNAMSTLAYWNSGLRLDTCPALPVYCTGESAFGTPNTTPSVDQPASLRPVPSTSSAELQLVEVRLPVSREQVLEDFPSEPPSPRRSAKMITDAPSLTVSLPVTTATATATSTSAATNTAKSQHKACVPSGATSTSAPLTYEPTSIDLLRARLSSIPAAAESKSATSMEAATGVSQFSSGGSCALRPTSTPARLSESKRYRHLRRSYRALQYEGRRHRSPTDRDPGARDVTPRGSHRRQSPDHRRY